MSAWLPAALLAAAMPVAFAAERGSGARVYQEVCGACHATGVIAAPVFGDRKVWAKLLREGYEELTIAALIGIRQMPPKGGKPELTDLEVGRAVVYMANGAGGNFAEPTERQMAAIRVKADKRAAKRKRSG